MRQADRDDLHDWDALLIVRRLALVLIALAAGLFAAPGARDAWRNAGMEPVVGR